MLASDPADGEDGVDRAVAARVFFDRRVLPADVHRGRVSLASGARGAFVSPSFDPVEQVLTLALVAGPLDPTVRYRLRVEGLHDLDLVPMDEPFEITFDTGTEVSAVPPAEVSFADVAPLFEACASAGCHAPPAPVLGLDLSSARGIRETAINVPAAQGRVGVQADEPWRGAATLAGLARIEVLGGVGHPARSYLLYKVLGDPHVGGVRMPPEPAAPLSREALAQLSEWIRSGAPTD